MSVYETDHHPNGTGSSRIRRLLHQSFIIKRVHDLLLDEIAEQYDLTRIQVDVIAFLLNNPDLDTARDIVDYRLIAKSHVSKAVDKLLSEGYLTREYDGTDRRCIHLTLTEKAADVAKEIQVRQQEFTAKLKEGISEQEMAYLDEITDRIVANAENMI